MCPVSRRSYYANGTRHNPSSNRHISVYTEGDDIYEAEIVRSSRYPQRDFYSSPNSTPDFSEWRAASGELTPQNYQPPSYKHGPGSEFRQPPPNIVDARPHHNPDGTTYRYPGEYDAPQDRPPFTHSPSHHPGSVRYADAAYGVAPGAGKADESRFRFSVEELSSGFFSFKGQASRRAILVGFLAFALMLAGIQSIPGALEAVLNILF